MNPVFSPPEAVLSVIGRLFEHGHDAWLVGGCVRDVLLGHPPADWDICTSAHPDVVLSLFPGSLDTGAGHGTITALVPDNETTGHRLPVEITTWRSESGYTDHRHPDVVRFSDSLQTDLSRRDFTINAMAWQPEKGLVDLFGGQLDLERRLVRCVGDPLARFQEDALRMLRAIRFCSQLGFSLDRDAVKAIRYHRDAIGHVSRERIQHEMNRTLGGRYPSCASLWWETGLHRTLFELPGLPVPTNPGEWLKVLDNASMRCLLPEDNASMRCLLPESAGVTKPADTILPWALFWISTGLGNHEPALEDWMRENRFPKHRILGIRKILRIYAAHLRPTPRNLRFAALTEGKEWVEHVLLLEALTSNPLAKAPEVPDISKPDFDGNDLKKLLCALGKPIGRNIGDILTCLDMVISERPECNRSDLLEWMAAIMSSSLPADPSNELPALGNSATSK